MFWVLGRVFGFWEVFWILGRVFGFSDVFWILESVLSLRATVLNEKTYRLSAMILHSQFNFAFQFRRQG